MASIAHDLMQRHLSPRAIERAIWFADITAALGEAEKLLALLERDGGYPEETGQLRQRIQIVRSELNLLNRVILSEGRIVPGSWPESPRAGGAER